MGRSLYEITEEIQQLNAIVDSFDPDFEREGAEQSLLQWVGEIGEEHDRKIDAYVAVIREYEYEEKACRSEASRLEEKARAAAGHILRLKAAMFNHMKALKVTKLATTLHTVAIQKNGGQVPVIILDENLLPPDCFAAVEPPPDKTVIRNKLLAGQEVPGAKLGEAGESLRIR